MLLVGAAVARGQLSASLETGRIEGLIHRYDLDNHVLALSHRNDPEVLYRVCDLTVLLSLYEGTPNVVLESLACGVPAVVADVPGCREMATLCPSIRTFESGNVDALVSALERIHRQRSLLPDLGRLGREQVNQHFSDERMLTGFAALYTALANDDPA
ncbi:MAG: glycosyltransferase family 4 protein [Gammaproteobacteria bacterium]|nr:glycosyltransferase family 4 protein [Gammaproteobacteria bacterium]